MKESQAVAELLEVTFNKIHQEQMQEIPILNSLIAVEALGFHEYQGRIVGIVITPWMMNMFMLPKDGEDWSQYEIGHKLPHQFPSNTYKFMVNEIDGIGYCQTYSIFSPMHEFANHEHALSAAQSFLDTMMIERDPQQNEEPDEELLGRILRGEEAPLSHDELAGFEHAETNAPEKAASESIASEIKSKPDYANINTIEEKIMTRRDLLRGSFMRST